MPIFIYVPIKFSLVDIFWWGSFLVFSFFSFFFICFYFLLATGNQLVCLHSHFYDLIPSQNSSIPPFHPLQVCVGHSVPLFTRAESFVLFVFFGLNLAFQTISPSPLLILPAVRDPGPYAEMGYLPEDAIMVHHCEDLVPN